MKYCILIIFVCLSMAAALEDLNENSRHVDLSAAMCEVESIYYWNKVKRILDGE